MTKHGNHIHLQVGAQLDGNWIRTPEELNWALENAAPHRVEFWPTSPFTRGLGQHFTADKVHHKHTHLTVVGPNPWLSVEWSRRLESEWTGTGWRLVVSA